MAKKKTRKSSARREPGPQVIAPQSPLSQYGDKPFAAFQVYRNRAGGEQNAITFQEFRAMWDEEQGVIPSAPPVSVEPIVEEVQATEVSVFEFEVRDPTVIYQTSLPQPPKEGYSRDKQLRPQRCFNIFPDTNNALNQLAHREKMGQGFEGARKNDWLEAAVLMMLERVRTDRELYEAWCAKARRLRAISVTAQSEGQSAVAGR